MGHPPHDVGNMCEKQLPILMACCLSVRYEVNQLRAVPDMPYHVDRRNENIVVDGVESGG